MLGSPVALVYRRELRLAAAMRVAIGFVVEVMGSRAERIGGVRR
jgi:hypothetical protein